MKHSLRLDHRNQIAVMTGTGQVRAADLWSARADAAAALEAHQWKRVLVDLRQASLGVLAVEMFEFSTSHAAVFPRGTRIAIVVPKGRMAEFVEFDVTVARNRGFVMQSFRDIEAANGWLMG